jgi:hypothetical protein
MATTSCEPLYQIGLDSGFEETDNSGYIWKQKLPDGSSIRASLDIADEGDHFVLQFDRREIASDGEENERLEFTARYEAGDEFLASSDDDTEDLESLLASFARSLTNPEPL